MEMMQSGGGGRSFVAGHEQRPTGYSDKRIRRLFSASEITSHATWAIGIVWSGAKTAPLHELP
jgi:hypothetical protein